MLRRDWPIKNADFVTVKYLKMRFVTVLVKQWKIEHIPTLKSGYPYEKFAKLIIEEKGRSENYYELYSILLNWLFVSQSKKLAGWC